MATLELNVQKRETRGKEAAKVMRREGLLPAVLYGHDETPVALTINAREFGDALRHHGSTSLIVLKGLNNETALIKEIQRHPYKNVPQTVDFIRVSRNEEVHVKVPVVLVGDPISVRTAEGVLVHSLIEVEIAAKPADLPDTITVDVSSLELNGAALHVSDIVAPKGVKILTDGAEAVAVINLPAKEEEEVVEGEAETAVASSEVPAENGEAGESAATA
ncbi:50S ribosomal protein L25 [bacterium]|nr:MAG: 50S ribosomal protein L25 [bacterium]